MSVGMPGGARDGVRHRDRALTPAIGSSQEDGLTAGEKGQKFAGGAKAAPMDPGRARKDLLLLAAAAAEQMQRTIRMPDKQPLAVRGKAEQSRFGRKREGPDR